jgi:hypothetical protein
MLEVRVARGRPGGLDQAHSPRRLLRYLLLLAVFCGVLTAPALAAGGGAGMPTSATVGHASTGRNNPLNGRAMWI